MNRIWADATGDAVVSEKVIIHNISMMFTYSVVVNGSMDDSLSDVASPLPARAALRSAHVTLTTTAPRGVSLVAASNFCSYFNFYQFHVASLINLKRKRCGFSPAAGLMFALLANILLDLGIVVKKLTFLNSLFWW